MRSRMPVLYKEYTQRINKKPIHHPNTRFHQPAFALVFLGTSSTYSTLMRSVPSLAVRTGTRPYADHLVFRLGGLGRFGGNGAR